MDRLQYIQNTNEEWCIKIQCFLIEYPEFIPYINRIPLSPNSPIPYHNVNTLFQAILHYVCAVGVRYEYAMKQWTYIFPCICCDNWETIYENTKNLINDERIQKKKRAIYFDIVDFMQKNNVTHNTIQPSDIIKLKNNVNGIGDGCVAWIKKYFTNDDDCVEYSDICFKKGFINIYGKEKETITIRKKKSKEWISKGYGRIANLMVLIAC